MSTVPFPELGLSAKCAPERDVLARLIQDAGLSVPQRDAISARAITLVDRIRTEAKPSLMEHFLAEYGLSTKEGVALMCLAEAMLRVPDTFTIDALIEDKIVPSEWNRHLGTASSSLVNASTWALMLTGKVLDDQGGPGVAGTLRGAIKRLGEPLIRAAVTRAMQEMGRQFVLGETIDTALQQARTLEAEGYTYSFDMLGEAARTYEDAARYAADYAGAISAIGAKAGHDDIARNPGISVKLSALHPRYEALQDARLMDELVPIVQRLARQARHAGIAFHIDAEEQDRLVLSLRVIEQVLSDPTLSGWDGFGVVVQAYGKRAGAVIDALDALAKRFDRKINIRLVKGAYWDTEMKQAQVIGLPDFPLFTTKAATDVSYICLAKKLFEKSDRLFPQFATHNAHTVAAVLELAQGRPHEFQRLHGMGERLHDIVQKDTGGLCRIYAPVGAHRDLLAYLVRRLLENGANSSFVHQIVDETVPAREIATDPFAALETATRPDALIAPPALFAPDRANAKGWDLSDRGTLAAITAARTDSLHAAGPLTVTAPTGPARQIRNPATRKPVGSVIEADARTVARALDDAAPWLEPPTARADALRRAADLYEAQAETLFDLLTREAGKTLSDCVGELREAVDFLRYYATQGEDDPAPARGPIAAISPWNFPLAIFTGQVAAALMAGNAVLAKPAEQTPLIATFAVGLLHKAGVPRAALQLLPGDGATGAALTQDPRIKGIVFTGSTRTARSIAESAARHLDPGTPLIAETGGLNAMIVDSTALPEQAVRDIVVSAFQSAGQRCSALRCLYLQKDSAPDILTMIKGAMDALVVGDPAELATDIGPLIDQAAHQDIAAYIETHRTRILHQAQVRAPSPFIPPTLIAVESIADLTKEIFGPVLHVATFDAVELPEIVKAINATGYGLTFGLHTRIDSRVQEVSDWIDAGNAYVNRNQIGAVVGSQPFGGEGLSGTGPKAGGPHYLPRFYATPAHTSTDIWTVPADQGALQQTLLRPQTPKAEDQLCPGPTGELNRLRLEPRHPVLCLGPGPEAAQDQRDAVTRLGGHAVLVEGALEPSALTTLSRFSAALWWGEEQTGRRYAKALAARPGPILPLITGTPDRAHVCRERHLCIDTTASGGNAALLAG
ncbi:MAG: bifunctional proline dehydrogenase/L-glutamate gamma-semialdehyde dehydrogenase PutA [Pseudomonadota bacterium]